MHKLNILIISLITIGAVHAVQDIEIVGGTSAGNPKIAVVNFSGDEDTAGGISNVIAQDLSITGEFNVQEYTNSNDIESSVKYIITGTVDNIGNITYKLIGNNVPPSTAKLLNQSVNYTTNIRKAAHTISNNVYQKITDVKGIFNTKIAYIIQNDKTYQIIVSDYDGYNPRSVLSINHPLTSLAWDNSGKLLSYVSFESGKPVVYIQDLYQAKRYQIANFDGSNSSPAFTPNGDKLAVILTKDYGSHIYLVNNKAYTPQSTAVSLISYGSIDTEASFANNGNMVFTSNHDGGPQIFMSSLKGSKPTRLTMNLGNYNTTPRFSHDASKITFINRNGGVLKAYVMDLSTKTAYPISLQTNLDMAPSFAPNDKLVLYSSNGDSIYIGNSTGTIQTRLNKVSGNGTIIDQRWANNY
jgi:TolB protein